MMERKRMLFLHLSSKNEAGEKLMELIRGIDRAQIEPVLLTAAGGNVQEACAVMGVETHLRPLCACFLDACYQTQWKNLLLRPGVMLAVARYCGFVRRFIHEQRVTVVCAHSVKSRIVGGIAARLAMVTMVCK